jgi:hypothetical protein
MLAVANRIGCLIEIRAASPLPPLERQQGLADLAATVDRIKGKLVVCIDGRRLKIMPADGIEGLIQIMRKDNPRVERSAFLLPADNAILQMQSARVLRAAGNPDRRAFLDAGELKDWLCPVLTPAERARLRDFLSDGEAETSEIG